MQANGSLDLDSAAVALEMQQMKALIKLLSTLQFYGDLSVYILCSSLGV
jgi:hypothetical protein